MKKDKKPTFKKFQEVSEQNAGCVTDIAKVFKVSRQTVHAWMNRDPKFRAEVDKGNDVLLDLAKTSLKSLLEDKNERATLYTLDRLGRKQGFGHMVQFQDKSKLDEQLDGMSDDQILEEMERSRKRIMMANGTK